ncbi:MAG: glutamine-hydrolyzing GMP synthase, partial [Ruminococcus sp.]|nr:glutamine-hydrolyzing GMP synthase [Ruminococcus sp.]
MKNQLCIVLDFGGQYNQLIARRVRECGVYCEIKKFDTPIEEIKALNPMGIIFTGGPNSVYDETSPHISKEIFEIGVPILGICYGCQIVAYTLGGKVESCTKSEYGKIEISRNNESLIFKDISEKSVVWMSHTDYVSQLPEGFYVTSKSDDCPCASFENPDRKLYAVQFHPEVTHSEYGKQILRNFLYEVCEFKGDWVMDDFIDSTVAKLREQIGDKKVILGLSGGVDSSVAAGLLSRAVGKQLTCVFVDQGLMRKDEGDFVEETFTKLFDMNFVRINCQKQFLEKLKGVSDPESKRKIIGTEFYSVFWNKIREEGTEGFFAQGTIYPDRIESGKGNSAGHGSTAVIKTHHNMVQMPEDIKFDGVIEPLGDLFKDEVRQVGEKLGIPHELVWRQPFPGPGLGVRIIGEITEEKIKVL